VCAATPTVGPSHQTLDLCCLANHTCRCDPTPILDEEDLVSRQRLAKSEAAVVVLRKSANKCFPGAV